MLTAAAIAVLAAPAAAAAQQEAPADERPAFEAATVKLAAPDTPVAQRNRVMPTGPNRLYIPSMSLSWLIYSAYGDGGFNTSMRVTGGPDWMNTTTFAVEGVAAERATPQELRLMLQRLLEDRFALKVRVELTTVDMLTLVVARPDGTLGPKVEPWDGTCPPVMPALYFQAQRRPRQNGQPAAADDPAVAYCPTGYRGGGITVDGATMFTVAELLSLPPARALLGTIVDDQTGLTGRYTMDLDYPFASPGAAAPGAPPEFAGPSLSTAVLEQWGLRVVPGQGPFRLVVVESAEMPASN